MSGFNCILGLDGITNSELLRQLNTRSIALTYHLYYTSKVISCQDRVINKKEPKLAQFYDCWIILSLTSFNLSTNTRRSLLLESNRSFNPFLT